MEHQVTPYIYVFIRKDLPLPQQVVQSSHACIEAAKSFLDNELEHPHLVVLGVKGEQQLYNSAQKLDKAGVRYRVFIEPDRNNEATAIATEPIFGEQRRLFRNYRCLGDTAQTEVLS